MPAAHRTGEIAKDASVIWRSRVRTGPGDTQSARLYFPTTDEGVWGRGKARQGGREGGRRRWGRERRNTFSLVKEQPHNLQAEFQARALTRPYINFTGHSKPRLK